MSAAFVKAERTRRRNHCVTPKQRNHLARLASRAGVEVPTVTWRNQASDAIARLEDHLRQPTLSIREEIHDSRC